LTDFHNFLIFNPGYDFLARISGTMPLRSLSLAQEKPKRSYLRYCRQPYGNRTTRTDQVSMIACLLVMA